MLSQKTVIACCKLSQCFSAKITGSNFRKTVPTAWTQLRTMSSYGEESQKHHKIYYGSLTPRMKAVKVFSLTTSASGLLAQPILIEQGTKLGGTPMAVFMCGFVGFFTFVTPVLLHFITKKYVTEIHYDATKNEYEATTISFFLTKIKTNFKAEDVKVPDVPGMFTSFVVKGTPLFVDPTQFTDTDHYIKIMGYDKPIDFKLNLQENEKISEKK